MSLLYGASDQEPRDRLHVCKIGKSWVASFRGGKAESLARDRHTSIAFELPYSDRIPGALVAVYLQRQNPGLLIIVDEPVFA